MTKRAVCKCAGASFTYADDSKNLKEMLKDRNFHAGFLMAQRLTESLKGMKTHCGIDIDQMTIDTSVAIEKMCKDKTIMNKMNYNEAITMETLLDNIESDVVTKLQRCERGD